MMVNSGFRYDINGLRAIAVIAVVLFHFNSDWVPGGFSGVDIFFVISGFLMTGIIFKGLESGRFSLLKFYISRANRIIPALSALCLALLLFGWFYLTSVDYRPLGKHVASSITFLSNITYLRESGYFDSASHEKWLLHTWSLSVEWQFYIIYPLSLLLIKKILPLNTIKKLLILATAIGFIFCVIATYKWPASSYFLLSTRVWEMMIGGLAYLYPFKLTSNRKKICEYTGVLLILGSYFFISKEDLWPGYLAIFPVLGAFLLIQANRNDSVITNNIVFQNLGRWSYSIYLWHWPLVVFIYVFSLSHYFIYPGIILSVVLGFLSYQYIEKIKFTTPLPDWRSFARYKPLYMVLFVFIMGRAVYMTHGFIWHYSDEVTMYSNEANNSEPYDCMDEDKFLCIIGNKDNIKAIIVGDSHADALTTSLAHVFDLNSEGIISLSKASCPFILDIKSTNSGEECLKKNIKRMDFFNSEYPNIPVFWVARTGVYLYGQTDKNRIKSIADTKPAIYFTHRYDEVQPALFDELEHHLRKTFEELSKNRPVYVVLPTPEMKGNVPKTMAKEIMFGRHDVDLSIDYSTYYQRNEAIIKMMNNIQADTPVALLDPTPYLCSEGKCFALYNKRPIYFDGDHMSEYGNKLLTPMFEHALHKAAENN